MIKQAAVRNKKCLVLTRGRKIVDQASQRLFREKVDHSVLMAGHWAYRGNHSVNVASVDTLISRNTFPEASLVIVDECHMATSKGYKEVLSHYQNSFIVSVTATPYDIDLSHLAESIVHPISMNDLIEQGYLVPFRYFAPTTPDLTQVHVSSSTKDYVTDELETAMTAGQLTGKIVEHWIKIAKDIPTICFCVNVNHSKILVENFKSHGINAEHCDANTPDEKRNEIIYRIESGETKIICNVGILGVGVDVPCVGAIIMARPTRSRNLFIQQCGRSSRIFPDKKNAIILDHSGNILRHGLPTDEPEIDLNFKTKEKSIPQSKTCHQCFCIFRGAVCLECGKAVDSISRVEPIETNDQLKEVDAVFMEFLRLKQEAKKTGKPHQWALHQLVKSVGQEKASPHLPKYFNNPFSSSPYRGFKKAQ